MLSGSNSHYHGRRRSSVQTFSFLLRQSLQFLILKIPLPVLLLIGVQSGWVLYDRHVTSQQYFRPPRPYIPPTESSPLSPFYDDHYNVYNGPIRAFPPHSFPCASLMHESRFQSPGSTLSSGFFFLMQPRVASATLAGVTSRIARNVAQRDHAAEITVNQTACASWTASVNAKRLKNRNMESSMLWTMVREPVDRVVSQFFHLAVSRDGMEPTLENFKSFMEKMAYRGYGSYLKAMTMRRHLNPHRNDLLATYVNEILMSYDFVGVLERLDESLAVLQLLLGLETQDMLYLTTRSSKAVGGASYEPFEDTSIQNMTCLKLQRIPVLPLPWKEFLHQPYLFEEVFEADVYVYQAMNKSLDATIDSLGRDRVDQAVKRLTWAQREMEGRCALDAVFPCSAEGRWQATTDCFVSDVGCGSTCIDDFGKSLSTSTEIFQIK